MYLRVAHLLGICGLLSLASAGCVVETTAPAPPPVVESPSGSLVLDWTIDGVTDPNRCSQSSAAAIDIRVYDAAGGFVGEYQQACTSFSTSIGLARGSYTADAGFVDSAGNARTTRVPINGFTIRGNDTLDVAVDFPASSYY